MINYIWTLLLDLPIMMEPIKVKVSVCNWENTLIKQYEILVKLNIN